MDIPAALRWILLAFALISLFLAVRALRAALRAAPGARTEPWLDTADHAVSAFLVAALALPGEHWGLSFGGLAGLGAVLAWRGVRAVRGRRATPDAA
ncbi:hypothetical protein ACIRP0_16905 [Streptomyces sp. NPDC101733]|uniref:hypothetical protein n=1 Tax=unclassified Streptomyces TaxID=2593676 RepID=UPI0038136438